MYIQMRHCAKASIEKFENWNIKQMALLVPSAHRGICSQRLVNFSSKPFPIPCLCQKKDTKGLGKLAFHEISLVKIQEYVSPSLPPFYTLFHLPSSDHTWKMFWQDTQCQLCKRLAGPFIPLSWSCVVWKKSFTLDVITRGSQRPFSCVFGHFRHDDDKQSTKQSVDPSASLLLRRQSFAMCGSFADFQTFS